jgi:hypothetical protein
LARRADGEACFVALALELAAPLALPVFLLLVLAVLAAALALGMTASLLAPLRARFARVSPRVVERCDFNDVDHGRRGIASWS